MPKSQNKQHRLVESIPKSIMTPEEYKEALHMVEGLPDIAQLDARELEVVEAWMNEIDSYEDRMNIQGDPLRRPVTRMKPKEEL